MWPGYTVMTGTCPRAGTAARDAHGNSDSESARQPSDSESESVRVLELKGPLRYEHQVPVLLHSSRLRSKAWTAQSHFTRGLIQGRAATMP
jgi:hypothetical protein